MKRVCAYCKRDMGETMGPDGMVTHGMCPSCASIPYDDLMWEVEKYGRAFTASERQHQDEISELMRKTSKRISVELAP